MVSHHIAVSIFSIASSWKFSMAVLDCRQLGNSPMLSFMLTPWNRLGLIYLCSDLLVKLILCSGGVEITFNGLYLRWHSTSFAWDDILWALHEMISPELLFKWQTMDSAFANQVVLTSACRKGHANLLLHIIAAVFQEVLCKLCYFHFWNLCEDMDSCFETSGK